MTGLVRAVDEKILKGMLRGIPSSDWKTMDQGAATFVVAGFDPKLSCMSFIRFGIESESTNTVNDLAEDGVYLHDCQIKRPSKWALNPGKAEELWRMSEDLVGEKFRPGKDSKL